MSSQLLRSRLLTNRTLGPLALTGALVLAFAAWRLQSAPTALPAPSSAPVSTPAVAAAPNPLARLRVSIYPWAEVEVSGQPRFHTPRAEALELPAGRYEIVLRHPRYGEVRRVVELESGQTRVFRHAFGARVALP